MLNHNYSLFMRNLSRGRKSNFTPEERQSIVQEYLTTDISRGALAEKYGIATPSSISNWVNRLNEQKKSLSSPSKTELNPSVEEPMEQNGQSPEERIAYLEAKLKQAESELTAERLMRKQAETQNLMLNTILDIAAEQGNDLRKKSGAKQ